MRDEGSRTATSRVLASRLTARERVLVVAGSMSLSRHCATRQIEALPELRAGVQRILRDDGRTGLPARLPLLEKPFQLSAPAATPLHARTLFECPGGAGKELPVQLGPAPCSSPRPLSIALEANLRPRAAAHAEGLGVAWLPGLVRRGVASPVEPTPLASTRRLLSALS